MYRNSDDDPVRKPVRIAIERPGKPAGRDGSRDEAHEPDATGESQVPDPAAEAEMWKEKYLRAAADIENTRRRLSRTYADEADRRVEAVLRDMLPLADNLERAINHAVPRADRALYEGVRATLRQFQQTLARQGVRPIEALHEQFNPEIHEAVGVMPDPNMPPNTVVKVEQTGYLIGDRLLRPARVIVTPG